MADRAIRAGDAVRYFGVVWEVVGVKGSTLTLEFRETDQPPKQVTARRRDVVLVAEQLEMIDG